VVRALRSLGSVIASFEVDEPAPAARSLVAPPPIAAGAGALAGAPPAVIALHGKAHRMALLGISPAQAVVAGAAGVPDGTLVELMIESDPPLAFHARVKVAWVEKGQHRMVLGPYALAEEALAGWEALVARLAA